MNKPEPVKSRMQLVQEKAARGELHKTSLLQLGRKVVGIDKVVEDPENERKTYDDMDDLVASIKAHGVVEPPTVIPLDDGTFQIATGHRRYRAAKLCGLAQIEILVREPEDRWERRKKSLISNVQRSDIRPIELAESLKLILDNDPKINTQEDLAKAIGKTKSWVSDMLRIGDLPQRLQAKVRTSELFIPSDAVSKIARLDDPKVQATLVDDLLKGASTRDIRERINTHKGKAPPKKEEVAAPKPKWVFHTEHGADVIVQAKKTRLSLDERISALQEALKQAKAQKA